MQPDPHEHAVTLGRKLCSWTLMIPGKQQNKPWTSRRKNQGRTGSPDHAPFQKASFQCESRQTPLTNEG